MSSESNGKPGSPVETFHTIVVGGGQAGLAVGYYLARQGVNFIILDENLHTGDSWRKRWESLRLFTPSKFNSLPGMPFPKPGDYLPTKNEVADYLEQYVMRHDLPIRHGVKVKKLVRTEQGYHLSTSTGNLSSRNVIVATGPFQKPYIPAFASQLDPNILQIHSSAYCNPQSVPAGSILVVGAGNSGAEISLELARAGRKVRLSGRDVGQIPANKPFGKVLGGRPVWWFMSHVLSVNTPIGRKMQASGLHHGTPLGHTNRMEISQAGVELAPPVSGIQSGKPQLEDGRIPPADGVLWATGFHPDYSWIELPIFDEHGYPDHRQGMIRKAPGLYFIGLLFQTTLTSSLLGGVGTDAAFIAEQAAQGN